MKRQSQSAMDADRHARECRERARDILDNVETLTQIGAVAEALLAIEARLDELGWSAAGAAASLNP